MRARSLDTLAGLGRTVWPFISFASKSSILSSSVSTGLCQWDLRMRQRFRPICEIPFNANTIFPTSASAPILQDRIDLLR